MKAPYASRILLLLAVAVLTVFESYASTLWMVTSDDTAGEVCLQDVTIVGSASRGFYPYAFQNITATFGTPTPTPSPTATPPFLPCPVPLNTVYFTDLDNLTVPMLPPGASATNEINPDGVLWQTSNSGLPSPPADSAPNSLWVNAPELRSDKFLNMAAYSGFEEDWIELRFTHNYDFENGFDGGVLEHRYQFGPEWIDIRDAGGTFIAGGYNSTISEQTDSPIAGRDAWSGNSAGFGMTIVRLPIRFNSGLRWRMATDTGQSGQGWRIDNVSVTRCNVPGGTPTVTPTPPTPTPTPTPTPSPTITPTPTATPPFPACVFPVQTVYLEDFDGLTVPMLPPGGVAINQIDPTGSSGKRLIQDCRRRLPFRPLTRYG